MKNPFEQTFTKEEKTQLLDEMEQLKIKLALLKNGSKEELRTSFLGLVGLLESFLTVEEKDILDIQNKIHDSLNFIHESVEFIKEAKISVDQDKNTISDHNLHLGNLLIVSEQNSNLIKDHLAQTTTSLNEILTQKNGLLNITNEIEQLTAKSEAAQSKLQIFEQAIESVEDSKTKIFLTQKNTRELLLEVKKLYAEVFGGEDENDETGETIHVDGLLGKLENAYSEIEDNLQKLNQSFEKLQKEKQEEYGAISDKWEQEFSSLKLKIESLLPGALSAGLSQAYEEKKKSEIEEIAKSSKIFYRAIGGLIAISGFPVLLYIYLLAFKDKTLEQIAQLSPNVFLAMLPLYVPCLWVAYSADKKSKLSKRLAEEYAHKSSLSKTFEGISRQVSNISDNQLSANLESKLLYNLIQVSAENPGKLISDYDKSDHPLYEALDKGLAFSETLEKISFIPGIDKIISRVQKRTQKRFDNLAESLEDEEELADAEIRK